LSLVQFSYEQISFGVMWTRLAHWHFVDGNELIEIKEKM
jgi:hypothetical protein